MYIRVLWLIINRIPAKSPYHQHIPLHNTISIVHSPLPQSTARMVSLPRALALLPPSPLAQGPASACWWWLAVLAGRLDVRRRLKFFSRRAVLCVCFWGTRHFFLKIYFVLEIFAVHGWETVTNIWSHVREISDHVICTLQCSVCSCDMHLQVTRV